MCTSIHIDINIDKVYLELFFLTDLLFSIIFFFNKVDKHITTFIFNLMLGCVKLAFIFLYVFIIFYKVLCVY